MTEIGRCRGCDRRAVLDDGVCRECLDDPRRGRKWAEIAHRCRSDPEMYKQVYASLDTARRKALFVMLFSPSGKAATQARPGVLLRFPGLRPSSAPPRP